MRLLWVADVQLVGACALIGLVAGCNQVLGLDKTTEPPLADARFYDAPPDAPYACPPIGTMPHFAALLHQDILQDCTSYSISTPAQFALGLCLDDTSPNLLGVFGGPIDAPMLRQTGFGLGQVEQLNDVKLSADGDQAFVVVYNTQGTSYEIRTYDRGSTTWTRGADAIAPVPFFVQITSPSRRPNRHLVMTSPDGKLHELVEGVPVWTEVTSYTAAELGAANFDGVTMTSDGLRLLFQSVVTESEVMYTDRSSVDARFRPAERLAAPPVRNMFLTDDCSRIYLTGLLSVFYLQQQ